MSLLLDTNICSAHLKRPAGLMHRFTQYSGRLFLPTVVLGELYAWAFHRANPATIVDAIENDLLPDVVVLTYDEACAKEFGEQRGSMLRKGIPASRLDLMIRSDCFGPRSNAGHAQHSRFPEHPGLRLDDWLAP